MSVLSETMSLRRPPKNISPIDVLIRYRVLHGEYLTTQDGLRTFLNKTKIKLIDEFNETKVNF